MSCSPFLHDVVAGTTTSSYFTDLVDVVAPEDRTRFAPNSQILGQSKQTTETTGGSSR